MSEGGKHFLDSLPSDLLSRGFWCKSEAAWSREDAVKVIEQLSSHGLAVGGSEIWLPDEGGPEIPAPIVYTWDGPTRQPHEPWRRFVERAKEEAIKYVRSFEWDPSDAQYRSREPFFCLDFYPAENVIQHAE